MENTPEKPVAESNTVLNTEREQKPEIVFPPNVVEYFKKYGLLPEPIQKTFSRLYNKGDGRLISILFRNGIYGGLPHSEVEKKLSSLLDKGHEGSMYDIRELLVALDRKESNSEREVATTVDYDAPINQYLSEGKREAFKLEGKEIVLKSQRSGRWTVTLGIEPVSDFDQKPKTGLEWASYAEMASLIESGQVPIDWYDKGDRIYFPGFQYRYTDVEGEVYVLSLQLHTSLIMSAGDKRMLNEEIKKNEGVKQDRAKLGVVIRKMIDETGARTE